MRQIKTILIQGFLLLVLGQSLAFAKPWKDPVDTYDLKCGKQGGKLVLSVAGDPKSFNPVVAREATTSTITSHIFESLVTIDHITLEVIPMLARSWTVSDDGKIWIFKLRNDVVFNDGKKFTAEDVAFTFNELVFNSDIPNSARDIFTIKGQSIQVEVVEDYTVKFVLPSVFSPFLTILGSQQILAKHIYSEIVAKGVFNSSMGLDSRPKDLVGTGPYVLKEFRPGERIVLSRNQYYWNKDECNTQLPYLNELLYLVLPNPGTALLKFLEGEIDYYSLNGEDLAYLGPLQEERKFSIYNTGPSFTSNFIIINQNKRKHPETGEYFVDLKKQKLFNDKRFRQAISYAIDRNKMIDIVFNGLGSSQYGPLTSAVKNFYYDGISKYERDKTRAKKMLKDLGVEYGDLELTFYTNANSPERVLMASMIRKDLEDVGIKINFVALEFNNLVTRLTSTFDWEMLFIGFGGGSIDPQLSKNVWHSTAGLHAWSPMQETPATSWEKEIDDIFNEGEIELDKTKRKALYDKWQKIASDELPLIYTIVPNTLYAVRNRFGNVFPSVYGGAFGQIENVFVEDDS